MSILFEGLNFYLLNEFDLGATNDFSLLDYFPHLNNLQEGSRESYIFSKFSNKLKNRISEFEAIERYLPFKKRIAVLSFPAEYQFEREFYMRFGIPLDVYVMQTNFSIENAKKFSTQFNQTNRVFLPLRSSNRGIAVNTLNIKKTVKSDDITGDRVKGFVQLLPGRKNNTAQTISPVPAKFDLIDLDYMGNFSPKLLGQMGMLYHEKLSRNGIILATFNLSGWRGLTRSLKKTKRELDLDNDEDSDEYLNKFSYDTLKNVPANNKIKFPKNHDVEKYGINPDKSEIYKNMAVNIAHIIKDVFGSNPVYINVYRGGATESGRIMLRLAFCRR